MSLKETFLKGVYWATFQRGVGLAVSVLAFVFLIRLLPPRAFGLIAYANVVVVLVEILVHHGLPESIIQRETVDSGSLNFSFWFCCLLGVTGMILVFLFAGPLASLLREPGLARVLKWLSLNFLFVGLSYIPKAVLRRDVSYKQISLISLSTESTASIVAVLMALSGFGVLALVARNLIDEAFKTVLYTWRCPWSPGLSVDFEGGLNLYTFALPVMGSRYMGYLRDRLDDLIIGYYLGTAALGLYSVAFRCLIYLKTLIIRPGSEVSFPVFSKKQFDLRKLREYFTDTIQLQTLVAFPVFILVASLSGELLPLVFGPDWELTGTLLTWLCFIGLIESLVFYHESLLMALDEPGLRFVTRTLKVFLNGAVAFLLVNEGLVVLTVGLVCSEVVQLPLLVMLSNRELKLSTKTYFRALLKPVLVSLGLALPLMGLTLLSDWNQPVSLLSKLLFAGGYSLVVGWFWLKPEIQKLYRWVT